VSPEGGLLAIPAGLRKLIAALPQRPGVSIQPGWGRGNLVAKVGGKIFLLLTPQGTVLKLPRARVDALVDAGLGHRFDPRRNGRVMKEWVVLTAAQLPEHAELVRESHRFLCRGFRSKTGKER
jgi:hypothetical protein